MTDLGSQWSYAVAPQSGAPSGTAEVDATPPQTMMQYWINPPEGSDRKPLTPEDVFNTVQKANVYIPAKDFEQQRSNYTLSDSTMTFQAKNNGTANTKWKRWIEKASNMNSHGAIPHLQETHEHWAAKQDVSGPVTQYQDITLHIKGGATEVEILAALKKLVASDPHCKGDPSRLGGVLSIVNSGNGMFKPSHKEVQMKHWTDPYDILVRASAELADYISRIAFVHTYGPATGKCWGQKTFHFDENRSFLFGILAPSSGAIIFNGDLRDNAPSAATHSHTRPVALPTS
jgi:hypothetical protein